MMVMSGDEEGLEEKEEEEEIDVEASNGLVNNWMKECADPEECLDT